MDVSRETIDRLADEVIAEHQSGLRRPGKAGRLLSAEQSRRLSLLASTDRQRAVEFIAAHLRTSSAESGRWPLHADGNAPRDWYRAPVRK
jgi:hypothetical protein